MSHDTTTPTARDGELDSNTERVLRDARENDHHREMVVMAAEMHTITREALEEPYCIQCHRSVRDDEYDYKYIGVGGFLTGPFCSKNCHWSFLTEAA